MSASYMSICFFMCLFFKSMWKMNGNCTSGLKVDLGRAFLGGLAARTQLETMFSQCACSPPSADSTTLCGNRQDKRVKRTESGELSSLPQISRHDGFVWRNLRCEKKILRYRRECRGICSITFPLRKIIRLRDWQEAIQAPLVRLLMNAKHNTLYPDENSERMNYGLKVLVAINKQHWS